MYRTGLLAPALILVGVNIAGAQKAAFKSGVDVVALTVTVTDPQGRCVTGLTADHFAVFEDGLRQTLSLFRSEDVPVDLVFVLDTSSSMSVRFRSSRKPLVDWCTGSMAPTARPCSM